MAAPDAILITGGTGFLGRALLGLIRRERPMTTLVVHGRNRERLAALTERFPGVASVCSELTGPGALDALGSACREHGVATVIHSAAIKSIPEAELNVARAIAVNVGASEVVASAAEAARVARVVGVSSDKACAPQSVYGMTKALMERLFAEADRRGRVRFASVRIGNVFGSTDSVAERFSAQLAARGELEITDPEMSRFCLSVGEAARLVWDAALQADDARGGTFVKPCRAYRLADVATAVWLERGGSGPPPLRVTGARPGELRFDTLWNDHEATRLVPAGAGFCLRPSTETGAKAAVPERHQSLDPAGWLSVADLRSMMREAAGV